MTILHIKHMMKSSETQFRDNFWSHGGKFGLWAKAHWYKQTMPCTAMPTNGPENVLNQLF